MQSHFRCNASIVVKSEFREDKFFRYLCISCNQCNQDIEYGAQLWPQTFKYSKQCCQTVNDKNETIFCDFNIQLVATLETLSFSQPNPNNIKWCTSLSQLLLTFIVVPHPRELYFS